MTMLIIMGQNQVIHTDNIEISLITKKISIYTWIIMKNSVKNRISKNVKYKKI